MKRLPSGAWIMTAEGWREIPCATPQVVFAPERRIEGPIDWTGWVETGGRIARPGRGWDCDGADGYDWPLSLGGDE